MNTVRLITFDLGGTLISPHPSVGEAYAEELESLGFFSDSQRLQQRFDLALKHWAEGNRKRKKDADDREMWRNIVAETLAQEAIPAGRFDEVFEQLYAAFAKASRWRLHESADEVLETLSARGYRLAVLSNNDSRCRQVLTELGLIDYFEALYISGEIGLEKPDARFFHYVMQDAAVKPEHILHVGDSPRHDLDGAREAGWQTWLVSRHGQTLLDLLEELPGVQKDRV